MFILEDQTIGNSSKSGKFPIKDQMRQLDKYIERARKE
jgi:hypothetical protein